MKILNKHNLKRIKWWTNHDNDSKGSHHFYKFLSSPLIIPIIFSFLYINILNYSCYY